MAKQKHHNSYQEPIKENQPLEMMGQKNKLKYLLVINKESVTLEKEIDFIPFTGLVVSTPGLIGKIIDCNWNGKCYKAWFTELQPNNIGVETKLKQMITQGWVRKDG